MFNEQAEQAQAALAHLRLGAERLIPFVLEGEPLNFPMLAKGTSFKRTCSGNGATYQIFLDLPKGTVWDSRTPDPIKRLPTKTEIRIFKVEGELEAFPSGYAGDEQVSFKTNRGNPEITHHRSVADNIDTYAPPRGSLEGDARDTALIAAGKLALEIAKIV